MLTRALFSNARHFRSLVRRAPGNPDGPHGRPARAWWCAIFAVVCLVFPVAGAEPPAASVAMSKDLRKRGWSFVGPTTLYAFMQAMGMVNDHLEGCPARQGCEAARARFTRPIVKRNV